MPVSGRLGSGPSLEVAQRHLDRGRALVTRGRPRAAAAALNVAVSLSESATADVAAAAVHAQALISLGYTELESSGFEAAWARLDEAAAVIDRHQLLEYALRLHMQRGLALFYSARFEDALAEFDRGWAAAGHASADDRSRLLNNRSLVHIRRGAYRLARADLIASIAAAHGDPERMLQPTHNLGMLEYWSGDLPGALVLIDQAFALDNGLRPGIARLGKAMVLTEGGLLREADRELAAAMALFRRDRLTQDLAEAELERARCALALGDVTGARRFAGSARTRFRRRRVDAWRRQAELVLLQADLAAGRPGKRLVPPARRLQSELTESGLRLPARTAGLIRAEAELASGDVAAAERSLGELGPPRATDPITGRLHARYVLARVTAAQGDESGALRRVRRAMDELARYQASFGSVDLRTASAVHGRRLAALGVQLAIDSGRPSAAFAMVEHVRSVASRLTRFQPPDDPVAGDLLSELRQVVGELRPGSSDHRTTEQLLRRRRDLERRILARTWAVSGDGQAARPARLATVRARLAELGQTMITFVQTGDRLGAIEVGTRVRLHDLGPSAPVEELVRRVRADLDVLANPRLAGGIAAVVAASLARSLAAVQSALLAPFIRSEVPIVVVSTGALGQLPWAALPALRGRPLVVASSASSWLTASRSAVSEDRTQVLALAGPDLERADDEIEAVGRTWPAARVEPAATRAGFLGSLAATTVLHLAAHGLHNSQSPLFSSVRMTDGPVFAHELDRSVRAPQHVVLSACDAGRATVRPGDEALGLASVLLQLGTHSVIASVARVGDDLAAEAMTRYHARLAAGADSATALADALAATDTPVPFVCFGAAWQAPLPVRGG